MAQPPFDKYSITHAAVGALFELSGVSPTLALGSHITFEAAEDELKRRYKRIWPDAAPDSIQNHVGDFASFAGGYYMARGARRSEGGRLAVTALVGAGAAVWALALAKGELWKTT